jgi:ribosomal protein S18 acetylase RimI-like enzyme
MSLIREYRDEDAPRLRECLVKLQEYERGMDGLLAEGELIAARYIEFILARCAETGGRVFVAEDEGRVVGFVSVWAKVESRAIEERVYEYAYVSDLVVLGTHRGRGLGRALLRRAEEHARGEGATLLRIAVLAKNDGARRLYESFGFEERLLELTKAL